MLHCGPASNLSAYSFSLDGVSCSGSIEIETMRTLAGFGPSLHLCLREGRTHDRAYGAACREDEIQHDWPCSIQAVMKRDFLATHIHQFHIRGLVRCNGARVARFGHSVMMVMVFGFVLCQAGTGCYSGGNRQYPRKTSNSSLYSITYSLSLSVLRNITGLLVDVAQVSPKGSIGTAMGTQYFDGVEHLLGR